MLSSIRGITKANCHLSRNHLVYISFTILIVFLILGFRDARKNYTEEKTTFYEKSVLLHSNVTDQYYPNGFDLTSDQVDMIKEEFEFVTTYKTTNMDTSTSQHVSFIAVSPDFIKTGVVCHNCSLNTDVVEKIDLISGDIWSKDLAEPIVIIDENTANSLFGHLNVLGQSLPTIYGDLRIVGVVSNTTERAQEIYQAIEAGQPIDQNMYNTFAYIPNGYLSTLSEVESYDGSVIIRDDSVEIEELKARVKEILGVREGQNFLIYDRQQTISQALMGERIFFQIFISLITILAILEAIVLIRSYYLARGKIEKVKKLPAFPGRQFIRRSLLGGVVLGLGCSLAVVNVGSCIMIAAPLWVPIHLNLLHLVILSFFIVIAYAIVVSLLNLATAIFTVPEITVKNQ
jgi:hypothetical protein